MNSIEQAFSIETEIQKVKRIKPVDSENTPFIHHSFIYEIHPFLIQFNSQMEIKIYFINLH